MSVLYTAPVAAPSRSVSQRMDALRHANEIRLYRARVVKPALQAHEVGVFDVLDDEMCASLKVFDLLMSIDGLGRVKVESILQRCGISWRKTCSGITPRQREALATALSTRHPYPPLRTENAESVLAGRSMDA
jgi:hypothetical protein